MTSTERETILDRMAKEFMQPQVTDRRKWYQADTREGTQIFPANMFSLAEVASQCEVEAEDVEEVTGFGARLSAPGYMDCTDWSVFDSREEAEQYLVDTYGDDLPDEDEDSEENQPHW